MDIVTEGLAPRRSDREARALAQIVPTQDERDKAQRATVPGVPEGMRGPKALPSNNWARPSKIQSEEMEEADEA